MIDFFFESFVYGKKMRRNDPQQRDHKIQNFEQQLLDFMVFFLLVCFDC